MYARFSRKSKFLSELLAHLFNEFLVSEFALFEFRSQLAFL